jgi:integrase
MITLQNALFVVSEKQQQQILFLRSVMASECPTTMKALRLVDHEYTTGKLYKGYNLVKRDNKKIGFVYYVRYWHEGRMLASKWCTHTNDYAKACQFAEQKREELITNYLSKTGGDAVRFFKRYYDQKSIIFQNECRRNGEITEERRKRYQTVMEKKFIPFLKERKINNFEEITVPVLDDFQDLLLARGMKAQSVNYDMAAVSRTFKYLMRKGMIKANPFFNLSPVPERQEEKKTHGCYEIGALKGVFERRWKDKTSQLLNLIIYATGMRDCEIKAFSKDDIITMSGLRFIDLKESKTENGIRIIPLHDAVYRKIMDYAKVTDTAAPVFGSMNGYRFSKAYKDLAAILKVSDERLKEQNITYYSGRHFWKTLMNANGLGEDVEEIFMGHKVSGDVSKLYNHYDMQGKDRIIKKAREVFRILDKYLFATK